MNQITVPDLNLEVIEVSDGHWPKDEWESPVLEEKEWFWEEEERRQGDTRSNNTRLQPKEDFKYVTLDYGLH